MPLRSVNQDRESLLVQNDGLVQSVQLRILKLEELKSFYVSKSETDSVPQVRNKTQKTNKSKIVIVINLGTLPQAVVKYFDKKRKQVETLIIQKLEKAVIRQLII